MTEQASRVREASASGLNTVTADNLPIYFRLIAPEMLRKTAIGQFRQHLPNVFAHANERMIREMSVELVMNCAAATWPDASADLKSLAAADPAGRGPASVASEERLQGGCFR